MKYISKTIEIILNIIIFLIFVLIIFASIYIVQTKILHKEYADIFGYTGFEVITGSMSGTIEVGDVIIVQITKDVTENEIIVYKEGNSFITHRIIKVNEQNIITKGDANNSEDKEIDREQVLGKVIKIIPNIAIWKKVLSTPVVFVSIITTILLFGFAFSYEGENKKQNTKGKIKNDNK